MKNRFRSSANSRSNSPVGPHRPSAANWNAGRESDEVEMRESAATDQGLAERPGFQPGSRICRHRAESIFQDCPPPDFPYRSALRALRVRSTTMTSEGRVKRWGNFPNRRMAALVGRPSSRRLRRVGTSVISASMGSGKLRALRVRRTMFSGSRSSRVALRAARATVRENYSE